MTTQNQPTTAFKKWYANNKAALAEKRKAKYLADPAYRESIKARAQVRRAARASELRPEGYSLNMAQVADSLELTIWALREWRKKSYFPEPKEHHGRRWFTRRQLVLLRSLKEYLDTKGRRLSRADKLEMDDLISFVHMNWES